MKPKTQPFGRVNPQAGFDTYVFIHFGFNFKGMI